MHTTRTLKDSSLTNPGMRYGMTSNTTSDERRSVCWPVSWCRGVSGGMPICVHCSPSKPLTIQMKSGTTVIMDTIYTKVFRNYMHRDRHAGLFQEDYFWISAENVRWSPIETIRWFMNGNREKIPSTLSQLVSGDLCAGQYLDSKVFQKQCPFVVHCWCDERGPLTSRNKQRIHQRGTWRTTPDTI